MQAGEHRVVEIARALGEQPLARLGVREDALEIAVAEERERQFEWHAALAEPGRELRPCAALERAVGTDRRVEQNQPLGRVEPGIMPAGGHPPRQIADHRGRRRCLGAREGGRERERRGRLQRAAPAAIHRVRWASHSTGGDAMKAASTLACLVVCIAASLARAQSGNNLEVINHPNYDKSVFMPFSPAIKVKSGKLLWLAGGTALPVYHDHPHKREEVVKYLTNDLEGQVRQTMDGIMQTLKAANASPKDVVHVFIFRTRPRMGDIGKASAVVNSYFAPCNHKPTTTNMAVLELGEPEQLVEIPVVAVADDRNSFVLST